MITDWYDGKEVFIEFDGSIIKLEVKINGQPAGAKHLVIIIKQGR